MRNRSMTSRNAQTAIGRTLTMGRGMAALCGALIPLLASAQTEPEHTNTFEFTPFVGSMAGGSFETPDSGRERDIESDTNFGLFINMMADVPERQYELLYTQQSTAIEGVVPIDLDVQYLHIGGTVDYPQKPYLRPYIGATIGAAQFSPDAIGLDDETRVSFSFGGGIRFPITDHFGIRFDLRAFITLLDDDSSFFCVSNPPTGTCVITAKSDTLVQYTGSLGVSFGF